MPNIKGIIKISGETFRWQARERARAKQGRKKMEDNIVKFQGKKKARPKETETKTVDDVKRELKKRGVL